MAMATVSSNDLEEAAGWWIQNLSNWQKTITGISFMHHYIYVANSRVKHITH